MSILKKIKKKNSHGIYWVGTDTGSSKLAKNPAAIMSEVREQSSSDEASPGQPESDEELLSQKTPQ